MAASVTDIFQKVGVAGTLTTLSAPGHSIAGTTITVGSTANWPTDTGITFAMRTVDASGDFVAGTYTEWRATVSGSTLTGMVLVYGTDQNYAAGSTTQVYVPVSAYSYNRMIDGLTTTVFDQDATLKAGAVDVTAVIADGIVTRAKLATAVSTELNDGWTTPTQTVSSVTNNGNRSYDVVFNSTVASVLSPGMRLRTTRTAPAPITSFYFDGVNDYFAKTTPNKMTFTDNFTCSAWVNLLGYQQGGIVSRFNGTSGFTFRVESTGQLSLVGFNAGAGNYRWGQTYQSLSLGKWTHVAASWSSGTLVLYIDGVVAPSTITTAGTAPTTIAQAGDLQLGATNGAGFLSGRLAQPAVFDAVLSAATIRSYSSQTLSGAETNLKSAYSGVGLLDLNTTTPNDLTASGALSGIGYSPFGDNSVSTTLDYALVMKVSTTTATVQVPEGCTIPTSGGVSAVAYSTATSPFGFTLDKGRWEVLTLSMISNGTNAIGGLNTWTGANLSLIVPIGSWTVGYNGTFAFNSTVSGVRSGFVTMADSAPTGSVYSGELVGRVYAIASSNALATINRHLPKSHSSQASYLVYGAIDVSTGTETWGSRGDQGAVRMYALPQGI